MINTHQYITIIFLINLLAGTMVTLSNNIDYVAYTNIDDIIDQSTANIEEMKNDSQTTSYRISDQDYDKTSGSTIGMGTNVISVLWNGFGILPMVGLAINSTTMIQKILYTPLAAFQVLMGLYTGLLIYDKIKNKKSD